MFSAEQESTEWIPPRDLPPTAGAGQRKAPAVAVAPPPRAVALVPGKEDNPTVAPGLVKWHRTLADAQAAAEKSGRPVLLFHMMGQLDKQFC